jgi:hypothetical protein
MTSGSFGDQTFAPSLSSPAGEGPNKKHFTATFRIGSTQATEQPGLHVSVSPDDGNGGRMSYLRFEDQADGIHVLFDDVTDPGPFPMVANFNETDIATLSRTRSHLIEFWIQFENGPHNDEVKIYIDGTKKITGTTWEDYYRYDPEQIGNMNQVPPTRTMIFPLRGMPHLTNMGNGFLVDRLSYASSAGHPGDDDDDDHGHGGGHGDSAHQGGVQSALKSGALKAVRRHK